jgi:hypothetical protein
LSSVSTDRRTSIDGDGGSSLFGFEVIEGLLAEAAEVFRVFGWAGEGWFGDGVHGGASEQFFAAVNSSANRIQLRSIFFGREQFSTRFEMRSESSFSAGNVGKKRRGAGTTNAASCSVALGGLGGTLSTDAFAGFAR